MNLERKLRGVIFLSFLIVYPGTAFSINIPANTNNILNSRYILSASISSIESESLPELNIYDSNKLSITPENSHFIKGRKWKFEKRESGDQGKNVINDKIERGLKTSKLNLNNRKKKKREIIYDVPIVINKVVKSHINYYQNGMKERFGLWLKRSGRYLPLMKEIFRESDLPEDLVFVALIESGFNPYAYSRARAVGPWQFIKGTARKYGLKINRWVDERRDPIKSTIAASRYLKDLYGMFGSWNLALASYNAGEGRVSRAIRRTKSNNFWKLRKTRYLKRETKNYVPGFMAATIIAKNPKKYGFDLDYHKPLKFDEVAIQRRIRLGIIAQAAKTSLKEIKRLNPALRRNETPPYDYILNIPYNSKEIFLSNISKLHKERNLKGIRHRIRRGETLSDIAVKYGTTVRSLKAINHIANSHRIKAGQYLNIPLAKSTIIEDNNIKNIRHRIRRGETLSDIAVKY
ncbi:MAG: transglycosylase SLT domain-containing protein, partial [Nitrospirota bacterium]